MLSGNQLKLVTTLTLVGPCYINHTFYYLIFCLSTVTNSGFASYAKLSGGMSFAVEFHKFDSFFGDTLCFPRRMGIISIILFLLSFKNSDPKNIKSVQNNCRFWIVFVKLIHSRLTQ